MVAPSPLREPAHRAIPKEAEDWDVDRIVGKYADVPLRLVWQDVGYGKPKTDYYYAELSLPDSQSWDKDGDLLYAEDEDPIDFYTEVFGAEETHRMSGPDGKSVMHAEMKISDTVFFIAGLQPSMGLAACRQGETPPVSLHLFVEDVDSVYDTAVAKGAAAIEACKMGS